MSGSSSIRKKVEALKKEAIDTNDRLRSEIIALKQALAEAESAAADAAVTQDKAASERAAKAAANAAALAREKMDKANAEAARRAEQFDKEQQKEKNNADKVLAAVKAKFAKKAGQGLDSEEAKAAEAERAAAMERSRESAIAVAKALETAEEQRKQAAEAATPANQAKLTVSEADLEFQVVIESDVKPGDKVPVTLPDGTELKVNIDAAAPKGSAVSFTIPSAALPDWKDNLLADA